MMVRERWNALCATRLRLENEVLAGIVAVKAELLL